MVIVPKGCGALPNRMVIKPAPSLPAPAVGRTRRDARKPQRSKPGYARYGRHTVACRGGLLLAAVLI
jgi:hypothetical protein